ncbi:unnamed protein product [Lampetra planeri]
MLRTPRGLLLLVRAERRGYYAVRIGRSPGLYATWRRPGRLHRWMLHLQWAPCGARGTGSLLGHQQLPAACRAVQQASEQGLRKLIVCTDSMFIVNGMGSWVHTWKRSGWRQGSGSLVVNRADFALLDDLCSDMDITWVHVQGHSGNLGNEHADQLAKEGADKVPLPGAKPPPDPVATAVEPPDLGQPSAVGQRVDPEDVDCASQADLAAKVDSSEPEEIRQTNLKKSIDVASWTL